MACLRMHLLRLQWYGLEQEMWANNYHKSLDLHSFHFKQQYRKNSSTKVLLAEIEEISDHKSKEDGMLMSLAAGNRHPLIPHLEFEYPDPDIHEDLYKLIKYLCEKVCTSEQLDKVMNIWTTFVEPMLAVPPRPQISVGVEDVAMILSSHDRTDYGATGSTGSPTGIGSVTICQPSASSRKGYEKSTPHASLFDNDVNVIKAGDSCVAVVEPKIDTLCNTPDNKTGLNDSSIAAAASGSSKLASFTGLLAHSLTGPKEHLVVDMNKNSESPSPIRPCDGNADEGFEMETSNDPQVGNYTRQLLVSPVHAPGTCVAEFKAEREGVELPPNGDFEEDNFGAGGESSKLSAINAKEISGCGQHYMDRGVVETYGTQAGENALTISEESEWELQGMDYAQGGEGIIVLLPCFEHSLQTAKPVTKWIPQSCDREHKSQIFYGNDSFYVLFRLHYILYERILKAKLYSSVPESKRRIGDADTSTNSYARFMNTLYNLLDGPSDNANYEDYCRANFGAQSYPLFTLDKLIHKIIKQLQNIATDEMCNQLLQLHEYETSRKPGRFNDHCYGDNARVILHDENTYHIECTPTTPTRLTIQAMDYWFDEEDAATVSMHPKAVAYMEDFLAEAPESQATHGIFLRRNKRKYAHLDETSAFMEAYEDLLVSNGLAKKISCRSSKVLHLLGTEDFMMRRKRRKSLHQNGSSNGNGRVGSSNGWSFLEETHV